jgi:hypothetical protein
VNSHDKSSAYQLHCGLFRLVCTNGMVVSDGTFQRISIKHSGFNPDSVIEASFKVLNAVPDIMNKVQLFQDRLLTDAEQLALATGAAAYRWEDLTKAPISPSTLLNPRRYGDGAKDLFITLNCVQENIIRGGQRDGFRRRPDGCRMPKSRAIKGIDEDMKLNKASGKWPRYFETAEHTKDSSNRGSGSNPSPKSLEPKIAQTDRSFL